MSHAAPRRYRGSTATTTLMSTSLIAGIAFAVAHHVYYLKLNDQLVGSPARQQWSIRIGTAFAFLVQVCLANTAGMACIQWVWRRCRQRAVSIGAIDAAFAVDRNMFMLLNLKFVSKFPVATGLALIFWCFPLSSLITPATLSVESKPNSSISIMPVGRPTINSFDIETNQLYSPRSGIASKLEQMFNIIAFTGERIRLKAPGNLQNATYSVDIIVPLVRCDNSDDVIRSSTASAAYRHALTGFANSHKLDDMIFYPENLTFTSSKMAFTGQIGYYASLAYTIKNDTTLDDMAETSELWIAMADPPEGTDTLLPNPSSASYYRCSLVNASLTTDIVTEGDVQTLHARNIKEMEYSSKGGSATGDDESVLYAEENYDSFASVLFELPTGFVLNWNNASKNSDWNWSTKVDQTVFGTAKDFSSVTKHWRDQDLEPGATIQEKNLTTLIEEFSLNASWSLMGVPVFTKEVPTEVNQTLWLNKYTYRPENLFIAYGCSIFACLITMLAGTYAIHANGESYDTHFSTISNVMQSPDVAALFSDHLSNTARSKKKLAKAKIQLQKDGAVERFKTNAEDVALVTMRT